MATRHITCLIPGCDGCGLACSSGGPACTGGMLPHFASRAAALSEFPAGYGWRIVPCRLGRPLMACRRRAAAGVIPVGPGRRWLLAAAGRVRRVIPSGPIQQATQADLPPAHPESATALLPPGQEDLLAAIDTELFKDS